MVGLLNFLAKILFTVINVISSLLGILQFPRDTLYHRPQFYFSYNILMKHYILVTKYFHSMAKPSTDIMRHHMWEVTITEQKNVCSLQSNSVQVGNG